MGFHKRPANVRLREQVDLLTQALKLWIKQDLVLGERQVKLRVEAKRKTLEAFDAGEEEEGK